MARTVSAHPILGKYPKPLIHCTGKPETGKTQLAISFALWLSKALGKSKCYVWPTDGREHEYAEALGNGRTIAPAANPLDVSAVQDEVNADLRAKVFDEVALLSVDTVTHIYRQAALSNQLKGMTGQGSSGHSLKAVTMMNVVTIVMAVNLPVIVITHVYEASEQDVRKKRDRDSISETEEARWKLAFNIKLETFKDDKGYGVIVRECRERPGLKPFILRDQPDGLFRLMPERIMKALYEKEPAAGEPRGWAEFGRDFPFPDTGEQFKQNAVREMVGYFEEVDGRKFYAFGDPTEQPIKQNGEPGINGAHSHALNAYTKVAKQYKASGGKNLGELTQLLKEYTEEKVKVAVNAYLDSKVAEETEADAETEQPGLPLEVEEPVLRGGGAAYAE